MGALSPTPSLPPHFYFPSPSMPMSLFDLVFQHSNAHFIQFKLRNTQKATVAHHPMEYIYCMDMRKNRWTTPSLGLIPGISLLDALFWSSLSFLTWIKGNSFSQFPFPLGCRNLDYCSLCTTVHCGIASAHCPPLNILYMIVQVHTCSLHTVQ